MFKTALASLNPRNVKEMEFAPLCLNEIGELYFFFLKRPLEAAIAYEELSRYFFPKKEAELSSRISKNFLASVRRAIDSTPGAATHSALNKVKEAAEGRSRALDEGFDVFLSMMADAARLEEQGKFREARKKYLEAPQTSKGRRSPSTGARGERPEVRVRRIRAGEGRGEEAARAGTSEGQGGAQEDHPPRPQGPGLDRRRPRLPHARTDPSTRPGSTRRRAGHSSISGRSSPTSRSTAATASGTSSSRTPTSTTARRQRATSSSFRGRVCQG